MSEVRPGLRHPAYGVLRPVTGHASVLLAENPSVMTLDGTNTWLLRAPGASGCVLVDPGPADDVHLDRIAGLASDEAGRIELVLITHRHGDHTGGIDGLRARIPAPVRALGRKFCHDAPPLVDGETIHAGGLRLTVLATPGHTADSVSFLVHAPGESGDSGESGEGGESTVDDDHSADTSVGARPTAVLTGDTVLGRGTTVLDHPDGRLGDYLASLRRLAGLPAGTLLLPAHGPELPDAAEVARGYLTHREERLDQVRDALRLLGPNVDAGAVVAHVYADVDRALWPAAEWSVQAQLAYLREPTA